MLPNLAAERDALAQAAREAAERKAADRAAMWRRYRLAAFLAVLAAVLWLFWWIGFHTGQVT